MKRVAEGFKRIGLCILAAALLPAVVAAQPTTASSGQRESEAAARAVIAWLESEEPDPGDLAAVVRYREFVLPSLIAALNSGPSPVRRERQRRSLESGYERLAEQASKEFKALATSEGEYVKHYSDNLDALYRVRAAQALVAIGGEKVRQALEASLAQAPRPDVQEAIRNFLETIK
jgi:hypothetical protein